MFIALTESKSTVLEKSEFDEISQDEKQLIDKLFVRTTLMFVKFSLFR